MDLDEFRRHASQSSTDGGPHLQTDVLDDILLELNRRFAPFVRKDLYGPMGKSDQPLDEKILLAAALVTLVPLRLTVGSAILIVYYLICRLCTAFALDGLGGGGGGYTNLMGWRRALLVDGGRFLARLMLFTLGFYWIDETFLPASCSEDQVTDELLGSQVFLAMTERSGMVADRRGPVGVLNKEHRLINRSMDFMGVHERTPRAGESEVPSVADRWVADLPLVGLIRSNGMSISPSTSLIKFLGCINVERESKSPHYQGVSDSIMRIVTDRVIEARENKLAPVVIIFPEGTTTNGEFLLPFKTGGFLSKTPVLPVILRYPYQRFSPAWESISGFVNYMEVTYLPAYYPSEEEKQDPRLYAINVRKLMAKEILFLSRNPFDSDLAFPIEFT
ncbi:hypothetical protein ACLOJK_041103 [Asimina triloba]